MKKLFLTLLVCFSFSAQAATYILQPEAGVVLLDHNCGGIKTDTYVTGFDDYGNISGSVYAYTRCSTMYYKSKTYSSWHSITWNILTGVPSNTRVWDGVIPDKTFIETDASGNTISDITMSIYLPQYNAYYTGVRGLLVTP